MSESFSDKNRFKDYKDVPKSGGRPSVPEGARTRDCKDATTVNPGRRRLVLGGLGVAGLGVMAVLGLNAEKKKDEMELSIIGSQIKYLENLTILSDEDLKRILESQSYPHFPDDLKVARDRTIDELKKLKYPMASVRQFRDEIGKIINQLHADQREITLKLNPISAADSDKDEKTKPYPAQML